MIMSGFIKRRLAIGIARCTPRWARRFVRHEKGATAVEFGMVLLPFLSLMFMTMETALVFFAQQSLETAAADAGRLVMTGQTQNVDAATFKANICAKNYTLFDCANGLYVDVKTYTSFGTISSTIQYDAQGNPLTQYQPGKAGDIEVVRLMYKWPIITPLSQTYLANSGSDKRLLVATAAFKNEPY
jgi:Flp pilus assembly protein TadG